MYDYNRAISRNIGVLSEPEQQRIAKAVVAIPGCGGVGSAHALALARAGISRFRLCDFDVYELENFNRQLGARMDTIAQEKVAIVREDILAINPVAEIDVYPSALDSTNIFAFLTGVDVVVDSLDFFAFAARQLLFATCDERQIPVVTAAPLGMSCALLTFSRPGMSFAAYFDFRPHDTLEAMAIKFAVGLAPSGLHLGYMDAKRIDLRNAKGPSHIVGVLLCAALATSEVIKIITKAESVGLAPKYQQFDARRGKYVQGILRYGNRNPWQRLRIWLVLRFILKVKHGR